MCELCQIREIKIPAERIDERLRELADIFVNGEGNFNEWHYDRVLNMMRLAVQHTIEALHLEARLPAGCLYKCTARQASPHRVRETVSARIPMHRRGIRSEMIGMRTLPPVEAARRMLEEDNAG